MNVQLNYGGILIGGVLKPDRLTMGWRGGDIEDEIGQMRRIAEAFTNLADAFEANQPS